MRKGVTPGQVSLYHRTPPYDTASPVAGKGKEKGAEGRRAVRGQAPPQLFHANRAAPSLCTLDTLAVRPWTSGSDSGHDALAAGLRQAARTQLGPGEAGKTCGLRSSRLLVPRLAARHGKGQRAIPVLCTSAPWLICPERLPFLSTLWRPERRHCGVHLKPQSNDLVKSPEAG